MPRKALLHPSYSPAAPTQARRYTCHHHAWYRKCIYHVHVSCSRPSHKYSYCVILNSSSFKWNKFRRLFLLVTLCSVGPGVLLAAILRSLLCNSQFPAVAWCTTEVSVPFKSFKRSSVLSRGNKKKLLVNAPANTKGRVDPRACACAMCVCAKSRSLHDVVPVAAVFRPEVVQGG